MKPVASQRGHGAQDAVVLFRALLGGEAFDALPPTLVALHRAHGLQRYVGEVEVARGAGLLSRLCAAATRLPIAGTEPITVEIDAQGLRETWTRHVGRHAMRSRLRAGDGLLLERLGLVEFGFRLAVDAGAITWTVRRVRVLGVLPLPLGWFRQVHARESERDGRYCFDVSADLPLAGLLVRYRGWLDVP